MQFNKHNFSEYLTFYRCYLLSYRYSRKVLWLEVASANNSPEVISGYSLIFVRTVQGIVITSRADGFGWQLWMHKIDFVILFYRNIKCFCNFRLIDIGKWLQIKEEMTKIQENYI